MTLKQCAWAAVDLVIDLAAENGIKYRRGDFEFVAESVDVITEVETGFVRERNLVSGSLMGVAVALPCDFPRTKKKLKERKFRFRQYNCCAVGFKGVYFSFPLSQVNGGDPVFDLTKDALKAPCESQEPPCEEASQLGGCQSCVCRNCMLWWSKRCPHGECYDDHRAKVKPYDANHPGKPPRTSWSNWYKDQAFWCRGGIFYPCKECDHYVPYEEPKIQYCLKAVTQVWPDGYVDCSLIENYGCERCYEEFVEKEAAKETGGESGKLFDFSEDKRRIESHGYKAEWVDMVVDTTADGAFYLPHGKLGSRQGKDYESQCPYYEGYWLRGGLGSVQCAAHDGLIPGLQWDKFCSKCHEECLVFRKKAEQLISGRTEGEKHE